MTDSIFDTSTPDPANDVEPPKLQIALPDSVKDLVGEGKKYATVEKALEALTPAQQHIARLEAENETLRQQNSSSASTEEVLRAIQALKAPSDGKPPTPLALDEGKVAELLDRALTARESKKLAEDNETAVKGLLSGKYGEKAQEHFEGRAKDLGMTPGELSALVRTKPSAAIELLGLKEAASNLPPRSKGSIITEALSNEPAQPRQPKRLITGGATTADAIAGWRAAKPT